MIGYRLVNPHPKNKVSPELKKPRKNTLLMIGVDRVTHLV
jgi:hypothetical protein